MKQRTDCKVSVGSTLVTVMTLSVSKMVSWAKMYPLNKTSTKNTLNYSKTHISKALLALLALFLTVVLVSSFDASFLNIL